MQNHTYSSDIVCLNTQEIAPPSGHYSHVCTAGGFVFISGQLPLDSSGLPLRDEPFEAQAQRVLHNIDACLKVVRCARTDLVQVRVYVACISNWPAFNKVYGDWIGEHKPARAGAQSSSLHHGVAVEVEAMAL
ncbi:RidA family protein [Acetobacter senegalensis]|uniref:Endoribonuclease L-PSP n=1 Tax=Acetobacter tropicalis TaxID=104102 RepID=A0A252A4P3_9PROT|nr:MULTISPECIES: RidA family protein [Acetobacter]MCP1197258.1 RidA family protein [Acetobacter senegalensis]OUI84374.1 endoribonuclease L-PSP [Acetobacter tropicalis]